MKRFIYIMMAVVLVAFTACSPVNDNYAKEKAKESGSHGPFGYADDVGTPDFAREAMEEYAKSHIDDPASYKFEELGIEKKYTYTNDMVNYRLDLQREMKEPGADIEALTAEDDLLQPLFDKYKYQLACSEYLLFFTYKPGGSGPRVEARVVSRYDANDKLMAITMDPTTLHTSPALHMLVERGELPPGKSKSYYNNMNEYVK